MRPHIVLAGWLAIVSLQAAAAPLGDGHELQKRQATDGAGQATPPGGQQAPTPTNPGGGNTSPATPGNTPAGDGGAAGPSSGGGGNPGTPANNSPTEPPSQPSQPTPPQQPSPASPTPQIPSQPPDGGAASPVSSPAQGPASLPAEPPASPPQQTPTAQAPSAPTSVPDSNPGPSVPPASPPPPTFSAETSLQAAPSSPSSPPQSPQLPPLFTPPSPSDPSPNVATPAGTSAGTIQGVAPSPTSAGNDTPAASPNSPATSVPDPAALVPPPQTPTPTVVASPPSPPSPTLTPLFAPPPVSPTPVDTPPAGSAPVQPPPSSPAAPPIVPVTTVAPAAATTAPPPPASEAQPNAALSQPPPPNTPDTAQGATDVIPANPSSSGGQQPSALIPPSGPANSAAATPEATTPPPVSVAVVETVVTSGSVVATLTTSVALPSPPPASGSGVPPQASSAAAAAAATATAAGGVGADNTECTTSTGLKGKLGPGGCFANARQDCTVSDGIPGATTDTGICAPVVTVGSPCSLSDGTKGTAQLQGLGTTLSCIGNSFTAGAPCSLPFNVAGTIANDGKTCKPPVVAPPAGAACPVPGITTLGLMQPDGKTCLPPTQSGGPDTSGGSGGPSLSDGGQCAVGGLAGQIERGSCRALEPKSGDPCFRGGQFAYFSNAIPDGILASDLKTCMIVNDTCNANGVQGRWSPSYLCVVPPPAFGNPTQDGGACQRGQIWGGRWDAASSTCILPGDPCPTGIYGPNARDCIAKPTVGTVCATAQGFNGTFNDAGLCVATIPPGARTPCLSVRTEAGTVSLTPNGTLCQIAPTPDTPMGVLQNIAPGSFCSNGKDSGAFTDAISCVVVLRPGGISAIPEGTAGNPNNDIASLQSVSRATKSKTWIPGVAAGVGVAGGLLLLALLAWKCGWFKSLARKHRRRHQTAAFGPGDGILEEAPYAPPQTFATVGNSRNQPYRDDNFSATTSPPTSPPATSRFSIISDQHPADPFADTSYNNHRRSQQLSDYSYAPEALSPRHPGSPSMMPSSPPMMAGSPPGSPGMQHVVQEPLLSGYPANPPAYPAAEEYGYNRR